MQNYIKVCTGHEGDVNHCSWSPVDDMLVSASGDGSIKVWKMDSNDKNVKPLVSLTGHTYYVNSCVYNTSGDLMASGASDGTIRLWSTTTWKTLGILSGHDGPVRMCCFSRDGMLLASASGDQTVRIWETSSMKCLSIFDKHDCSVICCSFAPVGWLLASGGSGGEIILSDVFNRRMLAKVEAHDLGVNWLEFASDSDTTTSLVLATVGQDNPVKLWRISITGKNNISVKLDGILHGHSSAVYSCSFSQNKKFLATGSADKSVIIWDVELKKLVYRIEAHKRFVTSCCFSIDGSKIASASNDKTIKVWDVKGIWSSKDQLEEFMSPPSTTTPKQAHTKTKPTTTRSPKAAHPVIPSDSITKVTEWMDSVRKVVEVDKCSLNEEEADAVCLLSKGLEQLSSSSSQNAANESLTCPITQEKFKDPVVAADGYTYERSAIMSWFMEGNRRSPTTNVTLPNTTLFPNFTLRSILQSNF